MIASILIILLGFMAILASYPDYSLVWLLGSFLLFLSGIIVFFIEDREE